MNFNNLDLLAIPGFFFLQAAPELAMPTSTNWVEIITQLGSTGVLLAWLIDLKKNTKEQVETFSNKVSELTGTFDKESDEFRKDCERTTDKLKQDFKEEKRILEQKLSEKEAEIKELNSKIFELLNKN